MIDKLGLPTFLAPRIRLFLSVDLVNSTTLKQRGEFPLQKPDSTKSLTDLGSRWFSPIASFYHGFEIKFAENWREFGEKRADDLELSTGSSPVLWKANGDELLYFKDIEQDHTQALACLTCFVESLREYRTELANQPYSLDVKGTAWLAGFPIANHEMIFTGAATNEVNTIHRAGDARFSHYYLLDKWYSEPELRQKLVRDFVGPTIDTGFRLTSLSTPRRLPVNVELAYLLAYSNAKPTLEKAMPIYYAGRQHLKGVLDGKHYPIFWIDTKHDDQLVQSEDLLSTDLKQLEWAKLKDFIDRFLEENPKHLFRPFVSESSDKNFMKRPEHYDETLRVLAARWKQENEKLVIENQAVGGSSPDSTDPTEQDAPPEFVENIIDEPKKPTPKRRTT